MTAAPLLHADADAFFASVATRGRPELATRPVAVVAHVIVASANYPARARGIRSAMFVPDAQRQCPELILIEVDRAQVEEAGDALFDLFRDCARAVEPGSVEEAFLDTGARDWDDAVAAGRELRRRAAAELGLPVSVGVGRTKLMAKLASRAAKPDGLHVIGPEREAELRVELSVTDVWGIGSRTADRLHELGVTRLGDLDALSRHALQSVCGTTMARRLVAIRAGRDDATVRPVENRSTMSAEGSVQGYARPDKSAAELAETCIGRLCHRAGRAGLVATGIVLHLLPEEGERPVVRKQTAPAASADPAVWRDIAARLLAGVPDQPAAGLRVTLTGLQPAGRIQEALF
jgi:DNA polymerase IV